MEDQMNRYDVFGCDVPAFEIVSDEEMLQARSYAADDFDHKVAAEMVKIAHDVTAATAAELVGLPASWIGRLEDEVAQYGAFCAGNLEESFEVRRTNDEP
jgi:hypothetical protein